MSSAKTPLSEMRLTPDEIADRGQALYEERLRDQVEAIYLGQYLVIDIETGDYEIGAEHLATAEKLRARYPTALFYGIKIGYPATVAIGGTLRPLKESRPTQRLANIKKPTRYLFHSYLKMERVKLWK